ncbi:ABC transporter ATP-binding protein/permease [Orbaceae bacterium ac157xtp]
MSQFRQFLWLIRPFWTSSKSLLTWLLLAVVVSLTLVSIWFNVLINTWNGDFYNALQKLDGTHIYQLLWKYLILIGILILIVVYADYLRKKLLIKWRTAMTHEITQKWLSTNSQHYLLQSHLTEPDNPDQRIAEDVYLLVEQSINLLLSFLRSLLTLISFSAILWQLSGTLNFVILNHSINIPGYMVFACILYTFVGIFCTHFIGNKLQKFNQERQHQEANYRSALIQCRDNGDSIAGQHGEQQEQLTLQKHFANIINNWQQLIKRERNLMFFTNGFTHLSSIAPIFFALPQFIAGAIQLGGLMQLRQAFTQVNSALSWFIFAYRDIAVWQATVARLYTFVILLDKQYPNYIKINENQILKTDITVNDTTNKNTIISANLNLQAGQTLFIEGNSGVGKSLFLRSLSGFWSNVTGTVERTANYLWIPQHVHIGAGKLSDIICYPLNAKNIDNKKLQTVLTQVGLEKLVGKLDSYDNWRTCLSGGEKQRLIFARLLINQPKLIMLDETTSGLDKASAEYLINLIKQQLPNAVIILVSHQTYLKALFEQTLTIQDPTLE